MDFLRWDSLVLNDPSFTKQTDSHRELTAFARFERLGSRSRLHSTLISCRQKSRPRSRKGLRKAKKKSSH